MKCSWLPSLLLCVVMASPAGAQEPETLRYRWSLGGFFGTLARIVMPGRGDGTLVTRSDGSGTTEVELDITAPTAKRGEYWHYGARINAADGRTLRAWSAYEFRGKKSSKESDFDDEAVIDVASGILLLRRDPPTAPRNMKIWNDGKIYPIVILPRGLVKRTVLGRKVAVRHFAIRARRVPNERLWKGRMDIFLAEDEAATPVEISVERRMIRVRLMLLEEDDDDDDD
ncbi:MAG: DUF3108 domain-containing protein [Acidobacteria bacterium]|nr:DUF3108 domain-containing protein [Acidobacteriota bacterium]